LFSKNRQGQDRRDDENQHADATEQSYAIVFVHLNSAPTFVAPALALCPNLQLALCLSVA
jgi:hypothetical protein